jgi:transposase
MIRVSTVGGLLLGVMPLAWVGAAGCMQSSTAKARSVLPRVPAEQAKCRVAASQSSPLVTEWPASEKANLEVLLRNGTVAVAYSGCSMRLLPECRVKGEYHWQRTTPSTDALEINDSDELFAKLPLGAASLEGELKRSGKLSVKTTVSGQLRLENASVAEIPREGACAQATHLLSGLSLGAFALTAGGQKDSKLGASITLGEASAKTERSADLLRSAGDFDTCVQSTNDSPHVNCASPIQAFLTPLPGRTEEEGPPGTVKVDFVSADANSRWDVYADDVVICTTPCERYVSAERPVMLRARDESFGGSPDRVSVLNLLDHSGEGRLQLQAHHTARGELATGLTFTALAGMGVLTGVTLTGVGYGLGESGMGKAGLITMAVSIPATLGSVWLILDSRARAEVVPNDGGPTLLAGPSRPSKPHLVWGPNFVAGTF